MKSHRQELLFMSTSLLGLSLCLLLLLSLVATIIEQSSQLLWPPNVSWVEWEAEGASGNLIGIASTRNDDSPEVRFTLGEFLQPGSTNLQYLSRNDIVVWETPPEILLLPGTNGRIRAGKIDKIQLLDGEKLQSGQPEMTRYLQSNFPEDLRQAEVFFPLDGLRSLDASQLEHADLPNIRSFGGKVVLAVERLLQFLFASSREGGIISPLLGTLTLTLLMLVLALPFAVLAAIYLVEYKDDGSFPRIAWIIIQNLSGVPSIVLGVFTLGFLIYGTGSFLDQLFFSDQLPAPTLGTGGLLWASLTLALLNLPILIVMTAESMNAVPRENREAALALGASRWQVVSTLLLPSALPGLMTGTILATARSIGSVAPVMLIGVVAFTPSAPVSGQFPFLHLDHKVMHLGYQIYDLAFKSPDPESARPLLFAATLVLISLVFILNFAALLLKKKFQRIP